MADENRIEIVATLDIPKSVDEITSRLPELESKLAKAGAFVKIGATLNTDSLTTIKNQISEFSKGLTINVGAVNAQSIQQSISEATKNQGVKVKLSTEVDTKVVNADVDKIKKMFQLGIKGETLTEFRQELKPLLQEFANAYKELDENRVQQAFQNILNFIDRTKNETIVLDEALKETQATLRQMIQAEGAINIDKVVKGDLLNIFNSIEQVEQALTTVFGKKGVGWAFTEMGKTTFSGFDTVAEQFKIEYNNLAEGIAGLYDILSQPIPKGNVFNVVSDLNDMLNSLASSLNLPTNLFEIMGNDVNMLFANVDEMSKLQTTVQGVDTSMQSLAIDAKQTDVAIEELLSDVNKYPDIAKISSGFSTSNADQLTYAKNQLNEYFTSVVQVEDKANRVKNAVADTEGELQRFYIQVEKGDKSIETLTYALNEQGTAYEFLSKTIREADNSTDFRRKGLDVQKDINTEKIDQFITKLKEANLYTGDLKTAADNLKTAIANVSDTNSMNKFLDDFDIAKAKFQALREESRLFSQQEKQQQSYWQGRFEETVKAQTAENTVLKEMKAYYEELAKAAEKENAITEKNKQNIREMVQAQQQSYWQGRFEESIKAMTAENEELKKMRQYYEDINKAANVSVSEGVKQQTAAIKSAMSELEKIVGNTQFGKQKDSLASMIGDTNVLKDLQSKFESAVKNANALKSEYQQLSETLKNDSSASSIQNVDEKLGLLKNNFEATTAQAKNLQTILNALTTYAESYQKIINLNQKMSGDNVTQKEAEQYAAQIEAQKNIITEATKKLQIENLYTKALEDQKIAIKNNANEIINQRNQQKLNNQATEEYNKALRKQETELNTLRSAYKAIATQTATLVSSKSTDADKARAEEEIRYQRERIDAVWRVNTYEEMLNGIRSEAIAQGERLISLAVQGVQEEERKVEKIKAQAEAQRDYNKTLNDSKKLIDNTINDLEKFNNSSAANKNSANTKVQSQIATNNNLIAQLQGFSQSLKDDSSVGNVQRIKQEIDKLVPSLEQATKDSEALNRELRDTGANNTANANLEKLKNQMVSFSNANLKAVNSTKMMRDGVTTFAQGWQNLLERLNSGKLDAAGIQKLTQDFQVFKGEVNAAGLSVTRVFTNMGSQLRMLTQRYISLYAVINYIKKMVSAVKELDTAMINVRRVTDETAEGYEQFLVKANKMAQELNTTTSTLVESAYQFAKMSYDLNQSLDLAKSATIFAKVADIEESTAVTELIATMKAFNIEAEKAIDIVDKLDNLNNKFAVSASGLGEGLERSASALAMTGNTLEQTLAMLTGAGEITQQLDNTGRMIAREKLYRSKS